MAFRRCAPQHSVERLGDETDFWTDRCYGFISSALSLTPDAAANGSAPRSALRQSRSDGRGWIIPSPLIALPPPDRAADFPNRWFLLSSLPLLSPLSVSDELLHFAWLSTFELFYGSHLAKKIAITVFSKLRNFSFLVKTFDIWIAFCVKEPRAIQCC